MRTLNADQLKSVLSMEGSLGHIHTLADVENTIDFLAKEDSEISGELNWHKGNDIKCDENHFAIAEYVIDDAGNTDIGFAEFFSEEDYRDNYNSEHCDKCFDRIGWYVPNPTCGRPMWNIKRWMIAPYPEKSDNSYNEAGSVAMTQAKDVAFNVFHTPWAGKIQAAFPKSFVNMQNELIFSPRSNSYFRLEDVTDETQLKAKILEWLTRTATKGISPKERKLHFEGINKLLGTNFTMQEMTDIYTYLGNGIKHDLCVKFVESGYDMTIIQKEG